MAKEVERETVDQASGLGGCLLWFFWGVSLSFMTILSLVLTVLLAASVALNLYLGWEMLGLEVTVSRRGIDSIEAPLPIPTEVLATIPTQTPEVSEPLALPEVLGPTSTPPPVVAAVSPLEEQVATLAALATQVAGAQTEDTSASLLVPTATPTVPPTGVPAAVIPPTSVPDAVPISTPPSETNSLETGSSGSPASVSPELSPTSEPARLATEVPLTALTSSNTYSLIPLEGERDSRPGEEHGDLNLKLRELQPIDVDLALVDIPNAGSDSNAPRLAGIFEPKFAKAYTIHNWDWACNCKGELIQEDQVVLVGIETTPGEPIFIPTKEQDIFQGKYYAVVLHASEDSLTFVYSREGTVAHAYSVHYQGLRTDPNLLKLYRESKGNELPGLTLDTPVGIATDELIVAIRDKGAFMDARSSKDWWD